MRPLGKNRYPYQNSRERYPRSSRKAEAVFNEYIKLGPTSSKPITKQVSPIIAADLNRVRQGSQKLGRPSTLDRKINRSATLSTSSSTTTTTSYDSTSDSDNEDKATAIKNNFKQGPGRIPRSEIIQEPSSSCSSDSSMEHVPTITHAKAQSWTITEIRMNDMDSWLQELGQLRELVKQRYDTQKHVQDLEEKIVKLEAEKTILITENKSLVQTVKHLVGEKAVQLPSKFVQAVTPKKEEIIDDDCVCIN